MSKQYMRARLLGLALLCAWTTVYGAETVPFVAQRLPSGATVDLDQLLADPHWQSAPVFDAFVERTPVNGGLPSHATRVQVLLGDRDLFVAVRAVDPQPAAMRARLGRHDSIGFDQDQIELFIDSVGSRKAAQYFIVNPLGTTADGMYTAEADYEDETPDFDFETRVQRDAEGYTAVFRLPFSTLRFTSAQQGVWRMMVRRIMPRDVAYEFNSSPIPNGSHHMMVNIQPVEGVTTPSSGAFLRVTPGLSAIDASTRENDGRAAHERKLDPSLDIKWRPLAEVVVDATINPDFSQVELDVPQLSGNTRFAQGLGEKRPFFQEGADLWQMPTQQLYTRAITDPNWGLRATRRTDRSASTVFVSDDRGGGTVLLPGTWGTGYAQQPASRVAATRLRWDAGAGHVALMADQRRYDDDHGVNSVVGTDFSREWSNGLKLRGQVVGSSTTAQPDATGSLIESTRIDGNHTWLALNQRAAVFESSIEIERIGVGFRNDTGFITQSGVQTVSAAVNRVWRNRGNVTELWAYLTGAKTEALRDDVTVYEFIRPGINAEFESGLNLTVEPRWFELHRVEPTSTLHRERYLHVDLQAKPSATLPSVALILDAGRMTDVVLDRITPAHSLSLEADMLATHRTSLSLAFQYQHYGDELLGARHYSESALQLKAGYALTAAQELRFIGVYRRLRRDADPTDPDAVAYSERGRTLSLAYRYTQSRYRALYLGFTHDHGAHPGTTRQDIEAYLKVVYAIEWRR